MERQKLCQAICLLICVASTLPVYPQPARINFQPPGEVPEGYLPDYGEVFGDRGNGFSYGWDTDLSGVMYNRRSSSFADLRYDTLVRFREDKVVTWEISIDNNVYDLLIGSGDPRSLSYSDVLDVEGVVLTNLNDKDLSDQHIAVVTVSDGRLTIKSKIDTWFRVCFIDIDLHVPHSRRLAPFPGNSDEDVPNDVLLHWTPPSAGQTYNVYFGESFKDVNAAAVPVAAGLDVNALDPGCLDLSRTYYWRVDEVHITHTPSVQPGPVWSFVTRDSVPIDDFERYNNRSPNRPFQTWLDAFGYSADEFFLEGHAGNGTGAGVGYDLFSIYHGKDSMMERIICVPNSSQSMPFYYGFSNTTISQTDRIFDPPQDWSTGKYQTLALHFYGKSKNADGVLYALINGEKVTYTDNEDLQLPMWHAWPIDLTALQINLEAVTSMSIGIESSGEGLLLLDDILLFSEGRDPVEINDPGMDGLVATYTMDGHTLDVSGHGHDGMEAGTLTYEEAITGKGLAFAGRTGEYLDLGSLNPSKGTGEFTLCMWVKRTGYTSAYQGVAGKRNAWCAEDMMWQIELNQNNGRISVTHPDQQITGNALGLPIGQAYTLWRYRWAHMAVTYDGEIARLYVHGVEAGSGPFSLGQGTDAALVLGACGANGENPFHGVIDEVAIYNRALSLGEVRYVAGDR